MPAFSVATNGDLACFARGINVVVAAGRDQARRDEVLTCRDAQPGVAAGISYQSAS